MPLEKTFNKTESLRAGEQQFLGLLHFFLSLEFGFGRHGKNEIRRRKNGGHEF